jgi:hypothetical protein
MGLDEICNFIQTFNVVSIPIRQKGDVPKPHRAEGHFLHLFDVDLDDERMDGRRSIPFLRLIVGQESCSWWPMDAIQANAIMQR